MNMFIGYMYLGVAALFLIVGIVKMLTPKEVNY